MGMKWFINLMKNVKLLSEQFKSLPVYGLISSHAATVISFQMEICPGGSLKY